RRIRATADKQVTVVKAEATGESERIRGAGDGEKNRVFAEAFGQDPDFFAFYRSMQAYEGALQADDTRLLLSPNSQFFQYFNDAFGKAGQGGTPPKSDQPAEPAERPNAPAGDSESQTPEQGAAAGGAAMPERDVSVGDSLPQAPQAP
ncbi:MAG: hypothetical protein WED13_08385, partial [Methyloceanibacter sp.]